jgi:hypothetical protein
MSGGKYFSDLRTLPSSLMSGFPSLPSLLMFDRCTSAARLVVHEGLLETPWASVIGRDDGSWLLAEDGGEAAKGAAPAGRAAAAFQPADRGRAYPGPVGQHLLGQPALAA